MEITHPTLCMIVGPQIIRIYRRFTANSVYTIDMPVHMWLMWQWDMEEYEDDRGMYIESYHPYYTGYQGG